MHARLSLPVLVFLTSALLPGGPAEAQSLRGSPRSVDHMYNQAVQNDLTFHRNASSIRRAAKEGGLVRLESNRNLALDGVSFPYTLPTTRTFINRLAEQYRSACGERLVVTSAARPKSLRLINSVEKSVHPTGMAVDVRRSRKGSCVRWMRGTLLDLNGSGVVQAIEERHPAHFHVAVFPRSYLRYLGELGVDVPQRVAAVGKAPDAQTYRVRKGDSLWSIARRHDTSVAALRRANGIRSSRLQPGQVLRIPGE